MMENQKTETTPREDKYEQALRFIADRAWLKGEGRADAWKWLNEFIAVAQEALNV